MFRLDRVLRHLESLEKKARVVRTEFEHRETELVRSLQRSREERSSIPGAPTTESEENRVRELALWSAYAERLRAVEGSLMRRIEGFRPEVEEKVRLHTEARREVEGLRKLKERQLRAMRVRRERKLQETIDDAASRRRLPGPGKNLPAAPPPSGSATGEETWPGSDLPPA